MSETSLVILSGILAALFAAAVGALGIYASRAKSGIPYGTPSILLGKKMRKDRATWDAAHRKASPLLWTATAVALTQTATFAVGVFNPALLSLGYLITLAVVGLVLIAGLLYLAGRA